MLPCLLFFALHFPGFAQSLALEDSLNIAPPTAVSYDPIGNLYVVSEQGNLTKYNTQLEKEQEYSSPALTNISNLDGQQMLKIFAFYQTNQSFQYFDRFLTPSQFNQIKSAPFSHFSAATLSNDQMIWLFDDNNVQLIKYNSIQENIVLQVDMKYFFPKKVAVRGLKEYGNRLYLWQDSEILIFDFIGNFYNKLPIKVNTPFNIDEEVLYYASGNEVCFFNLQNMKEKKIVLPNISDIKFVVLIKQKLFVFTKAQIKVYSIEP